jgi:hypothetical protein
VIARRSTLVLAAGWMLFATAADAAYRDVVIGTPGLVSYWRLDETGGTLAADQLGANPGTYVNAPALGVPGALLWDSDPAAAFDGGSQCVVAGAASFGTPSSVTVEVWVAIAATKPGGWIHFLVTDSANDFNEGFMLGINAANAPFASFASAGAQALPAATNPLGLNTWHHLVSTFEGSTGAALLYVDGQLAGTDRLDAGIGYSADAGLVLGSQYKPYLQEERFLVGALDEVALYSRALTPTEIAAHYLAGTRPDAGVDAGQPDSGLAADAGVRLEPFALTLGCGCGSHQGPLAAWVTWLSAMLGMRRARGTRVFTRRE